MRPNETDADWLDTDAGRRCICGDWRYPPRRCGTCGHDDASDPPDTAAETAITERPAPATWRCDGEDIAPEPYKTLLEATAAPPRTPEAMVAGCGVILAESDHGIAQWCFTAAGMRQLDAEMARATERDQDAVLGVLLAHDFALDMAGE